MPSVSWSEIRLARKCLKAHDYKYGQELERIRPSVAPLRGKILHDMLDAYVNTLIMKDFLGKDAWGVLEDYELKYQELFLEEQEEFGDVIGDCESIFERYLTYYRNEGLRYETSEEFVATDLANDIRFVGFLDKVVVDPNNRRWIMDHKFLRTIPNADDRFSELQMLFYLWARRRWTQSKPIDGIIWDYIRTKPPAQPEQLKKGGLSKRKNMDTTADVYLEAIAEHGLDPADYTDMLEHLQGKEESFFLRVPLASPPETMIQEIVKDFRATALMIRHLKGVVAPRNMTPMNCKTCDFRPLCEAEVRGYDVEFIRKTQYRPRDLKHRDHYDIEEN